MLILLTSGNVARRSHPQSRTPSFVWYNDWAQDYRLNLSKPCDSKSVPINPSILCAYVGLDYHCLVAVRYHRTHTSIRSKTGNDGHQISIHTTVWHSDIFLGALNPNMSLKGPLRRLNFKYKGGWREGTTASRSMDGHVAENQTNTATKGWHPCEVAPHYHPENGTWTQQISTGPEDPSQSYSESWL